MKTLFFPLCTKFLSFREGNLGSGVWTSACFPGIGLNSCYYISRSDVWYPSEEARKAFAAALCSEV